MKLWLDFETRSFVDLKACGLDNYAKSDTTEALMLAYAFDDGPVDIWLPAQGQPMPPALHAALIDPSVEKWAWNYNFEKDIFHFRLGYVIPQSEWNDPSILCANMSLPIGLDRAANALNVNIELKKTTVFAPEFTKTGKPKKAVKPVKMFSEPTKATKTMLKKNPEQPPLYFKDWNSHPEKWAEFIVYCKQDVITERAVWYAATAMNCPMTEGEVEAWRLDQRMNETGVWIDQVFVKNAMEYALAEVNEIITEMQQITQLPFTKSGKNLSKLDEWLQERGYQFDSLDKEHIAEALKEGVKHWNMTPDAIKILHLKQKLGGSAYTKLETILERVGSDGRLRDQFVYHGAHTGRWSGRGVQLQNLFKPTKDVSLLRDRIVTAIRSKTLDVPAIFSAYNAEIETWNESHSEEKPKPLMKKCPTLMDAIAGTIRASFTATPGKVLSVSDLAQIESRVLAALAGCQTMIKAYASGLDLYKDIMSFLLEKPYADITSGERANGKVIILGCGFGMGWEKFIEYAETFGVILDEATAKKYVTAFREKYSEIPAYWKALNDAVLRCVKTHTCVYVSGVVVDGRNPDMLKIKLPSGRCLHYLRPFITQEETDWGAIREGVSYHAWDAKGCQVKRLYGGLLCENVVQAVARDILLSGGLEAEVLGFVPVMTIHDEWVMESLLNSTLTYKDLEQAMIKIPSWAEGMGFILAAEGWNGSYYKK